MYRTLPLNGLRAFEAAARHLSLSKAARELHVTAGAVSHQIRGLEALIGTKLFERRVRAIALTPQGKRLHPGLQTGFGHIRDAVSALTEAKEDRVLVITTPPGFTAKWLAPRLYRFAAAHPEIDARVSSSAGIANLNTDDVDVAIRSLPIGTRSDRGLLVEKLVELPLLPVCSPKLLEKRRPLRGPADLKGWPLIHDDTLAGRAGSANWADWFKAAGVEGAEVRRGLRFDSTDHALDATLQGAGVMLVFDLLAYDDLRTGRLVMALDLPQQPVRAYHLVCTKIRKDHRPLKRFRTWIKSELAMVDWAPLRRSRPQLPGEDERISGSSRP